MADSGTGADVRKYEGLMLAAGLAIVIRDTGIGLAKLARMLYVGKTSTYRWAKGVPPSRFVREALWARLAEIRAEHARPSIRARLYG